MADQKATHPVGSILHHQNGATFAYLKAAQIIPKYSPIKANANGRVVIWEPTELSMPEGIATEDLEINDYSFFLIKNGAPPPAGKIQV